jgi:hypothetical protein
MKKNLVVWDNSPTLPGCLNWETKKHWGASVQITLSYNSTPETVKFHLGWHHSGVSKNGSIGKIKIECAECAQLRFKPDMLEVVIIARSVGISSKKTTEK